MTTDKPSGQTIHSGDDSTGTFAALITSYSNAWSSANGVLNSRAVSALYAPDLNLAFFDAILPVRFSSAAEMLGHGEDLFAGLKSMRLTPGEDLMVWRSGVDLAWTAATIKMDARTKDGLQITFPMRQTAVWERRANSWVIIHEHVSAPIGTGMPTPDPERLA